MPTTLEHAPVTWGTDPTPPSRKEKLGLPTGFQTEKGSEYRYTPEGYAERWKFDGTHHDAFGIAVFIPDNQHAVDILTRMGTIRDHLPPERQWDAYVVELDEHNNTRKVFDAGDIENPDNLYFVRMRPDSQVIDGGRVSLYPEIGSYVFEIGKAEDGHTIRHPGHRVSRIDP